MQKTVRLKSFTFWNILIFLFRGNTPKTNRNIEDPPGNQPALSFALLATAGTLVK